MPKQARKKLGLKEGDTLKVEVDDHTKRIIMQSFVEPPKEMFVKAGSKKTSSLMKQSDKMDEKKIKRLLNAIGVTV